MNKFIRINATRGILAAMLAASLVGCGQKGPLYLPTEETQSDSANPDAAASDADSTVEVQGEEKAQPSSDENSDANPDAKKKAEPAS